MTESVYSAQAWREISAVRVCTHRAQENFAERSEFGIARGVENLRRMRRRLNAICGRYLVRISDGLYGDAHLSDRERHRAVADREGLPLR